MIEGLMFQVEAEELAQMCDRTADYHDEKAKFYEETAAQVRQAGVGIGQGETAYHSGGNPADRMEEKARDHKNKIKLFEFMARHVVDGETYLLTKQDINLFF